MRHSPGRYRPPSAAPATTGGRALNRTSNETESGIVEMLDQLAMFQEFQQDMLPKLRALIASGAKTEEILEQGRALAAARLVTIAATDEDSGRALSAIKELLERKDGKVADKKQIEHKFTKMSDQELDALVLSRMSDADEGGDGDINS